MEQYIEILDLFNPIFLEEMDTVKLLNRVDTKYIFPITSLASILVRMEPGYRILEVNNNRLSHYETLYFDTPDNSIYLTHHNGKLNRFKIRYRRYIECDLSFFEVKFKNNKRRTVKQRIKRKRISEEISGKSAELLTTFSPFTPVMLQPSLWVFFSRMTFVSKSLKERLTIDTDIHFKLGLNEKSYPGLAIAELKQERCGSCFWTNLMKERHFSSFTVSKYCLGVSSLIRGIKQNNFKEKLHQINKVNNYVK